MTAQSYAGAALLWGMLGFRVGQRRPRAALGGVGVVILAVIMTIQNYLYQRGRTPIGQLLSDLTTPPSQQH